MLCVVVVVVEATLGGGQSTAAVAVPLAQTSTPAAISTTASAALRRAMHTAIAPAATNATGDDQQGGDIRAGSRKTLVHQAPLTSPTTAVVHTRSGER